jgi:hypothetical protein
MPARFRLSLGCCQCSRAARISLLHSVWTYPRDVPNAARLLGIDRPPDVARAAALSEFLPSTRFGRSLGCCLGFVCPSDSRRWGSFPPTPARDSLCPFWLRSPISCLASVSRRCVLEVRPALDPLCSTGALRGVRASVMPSRTTVEACEWCPVFASSRAPCRILQPTARGLRLPPAGPGAMRMLPRGPRTRCLCFLPRARLRALAPVQSVTPGRPWPAPWALGIVGRRALRRASCVRAPTEGWGRVRTAAPVRAFGCGGCRRAGCARPVVPSYIGRLWNSETPPAQPWDSEQRGLGGAGVDEGCYLVDPASSHMLVSKIKPCMCKYERFRTVKLRMAH